jgi:hypothetical protein
MYQNFIIPHLHEAQHVLGDTSSIIRSLKLHWQPLVFHTWKVVGHVVGGRCLAQYEKVQLAQYEKVQLAQYEKVQTTPSHTVPDNVHQLHAVLCASSVLITAVSVCV